MRGQARVATLEAGSTEAEQRGAAAEARVAQAEQRAAAAEARAVQAEQRAAQARVRPAGWANPGLSLSRSAWVMWWRVCVLEGL